MSGSRSLIGRIVSGGQTGPDRAALDVAIRGGIPYGGWCPKGGWAEDFEKPPGLLLHYENLEETPDEDVATRTIWNVRDSDATLILVCGPGGMSSGTDLTEKTARDLGKPMTTVDVAETTAAQDATRFIEESAAHGPIALNVAGPRESESPGIYDQAVVILTKILFG